jgi:deoxyribodipyrimidine photo-lyase
VYPPDPIPRSQSLEPNERFGLLITEDDCFPESILGTHAPAEVIGATATPMRSPLPVGLPAQRFATGAVSDAVRRNSQKFGVNGNLAKSRDWADTLLEWAERHDLKTIATAYAPVGPVAELLAEAIDKLARHDIRVLQLRRPYDNLVWPHASRGFFKLKDQIPALLQSIGISPDPAEAQEKAG